MIAETEEQYFIISAMGQDRSGLIAMITKVIANAGYNIIDIEQSAPHGVFYIILIIEPTKNAIDNPLEYFNKRFEEIAAGTQLAMTINEFKGGLRKELKSWRRIVFVGPDKAGMIANISDFAGKHNVNIHRMNMISRGEIIACEILLDISGLDDTEYSTDNFNENLKQLGEKLGLQIIIVKEDIFEKKRKLLILDLDENLIEIQGLKQFIVELGLSKSEKAIFSELTIDDQGSENKMTFLKYLKGLELDSVMHILSNIRISPGTEEMVRALKLMNYKIALISNSLSLFTDIIKERLNLDYAFGNRIEIENNKLSERINKSLNIDVEKKERLIGWLATMEKIPDAEIHQFGLDEKDPILSHTADLKLSITFDYDKIKSLINDKACTFKQIFALFINIGILNSQIKAIRKL
ncbi:MAG: hypothetical protein GF364_12355 [Candidatus Lokiarchaeota archaeon]|nr:hypothetical protein [Candidatus Lokiarchaeota archaeon]